ncbi:Succinate dehydrogenase cytochrome b558 subunit [Poriferisphaera corsica]|uniref:Succinate dehydrogenase cytochrome b558 subunit n=1 Tax=Poriferisphaera corsica TaxID=2528020 RepID=A0A517YVJ1_9BACT|nr:hypothetical protein [Poriferisphaera corsica]QDU34226.1 Succinate dehydrogenase cytochrome b558 subunit [Poriferisphaera corsica]
MSDSTVALAEPKSMFGKYHFLLRRLHSLSGIIPIGLFVCVHLFTNAQMILNTLFGPNPATGESYFQHEVNFIHSMPALEIIEYTLWASIAFHAVLGFVYIFNSKWNTTHYKYEANYRYTLQRLTGIIAIIFIFFHIATLRWRWDIGGFWYTPFWAHGGYTVDNWEKIGMGELGHVPMSLPYTAYALQFHWLIIVFYIVGAGAAIFHWANGLWTAAITWGLTITPTSQKRWGGVCWALGIFLTLAMAAALIGAMTFNFKAMTPDQKAVFSRTVPQKQVERFLGTGVPKEKLEIEINEIGH